MSFFRDTVFLRRLILSCAIVITDKENGRCNAWFILPYIMYSEVDGAVTVHCCNCIVRSGLDCSVVMVYVATSWD